MSDDIETKPDRSGLRRMLRFGSRGGTPKSATERSEGRSTPDGNGQSVAALDAKIARKLSPHLSKSNVRPVADFFVKHGASMAKNPVARTLKARELNLMLGKAGPGKTMDLKSIGDTAKLFKQRDAMMKQRDGNAITANSGRDTNSLTTKMESDRVKVALDKAPSRPEPVLPNVKVPDASLTSGIFQPASSTLQAALNSKGTASRTAGSAVSANGDNLGPVRPDIMPRSSSNVSELSNNDFADAKPLFGAVNGKLASALAGRAERDNPASARLTSRDGQDLGSSDPQFIRRSSSASSIGSQFSDASTSAGGVAQKVREAVSAKIASVKSPSSGLTAQALSAHNRAHGQSPISKNTAAPERSRDRSTERTPSR